jgi:hypothetical protein
MIVVIVVRAIDAEPPQGGGLLAGIVFVFVGGVVILIVIDIPITVVATVGITVAAT